MLCYLLTYLLTLLQTFDNIFHSADFSQPTLLVSLNLSAAFDTIDHATLLSRLSTSFGVHGTALACQCLAHILPHKSFSNCSYGLCVIQSFQLFFWCATGLSPRTNFIFSSYLSLSGNCFKFWLGSSAVCWTPNSISDSRGIMSLTPLLV